MNSKKNSPEKVEMQTLDKAQTFISGLDDILGGGIPRGRTTIILGEAGSGKTMLGLEFLYRGALAGEPGIFIGFEESIEQLRQNAATVGWDLPALEKEKKLFLLEGKINVDTVVSGDFSLKGLLAAISGKSRELGAKRVVIDALEVALRLFDEPKQVRKEIHLLNDWLQECGLTAVMTVRPSQQRENFLFEDFFQSMGDCVIYLFTRVEAQISTRLLRVIKYRGSAFARNEYPFVINKKGIQVAPISTVELRHQPLGDYMPTGINRLDEILGGGYRRSACILIAGTPGTGKTIMACSFIQKACNRGEKVLYIGFEESREAVLRNILNAGVDLTPYAESNRLIFLTHFPEAMGAEEHFIQAMEKIDTFEVHHVVVDAISACERMGGKQAAFEYLMRLLNACKEKGITIFLINQTVDSARYTELSGNGISSIVDTVISLMYHEEPGETNRLLQIIKSRGSAHSNKKWEFLISDNCIEIVDVYISEQLVLTTGTSRLVQKAHDQAEAQRLAFEIESKELELKRLRLLQEQFGPRKSAPDQKLYKTDSENHQEPHKPNQ
ncbi:MAG: circadian clock protein KaiC [Calditrichia bacterium]